MYVGQIILWLSTLDLYSALSEVASFVGSNEWIASAIEIPRSPGRDMRSL